MPETLASMDTLLSVCLGLGLAAACGFRVFVPLLVTGVAAMTGHLELSERFAWIASTPAVAAFGVATILEIGAYYIPWLDNFLDSVASPAAVVAGVVVSASVITGIDPFLKWTLAVIAGGGIAGGVQLLTSGTRGISTLTTAGFGNPVVSTAEMGGSILTSILALLAPVVTLVLIVVLLIAVYGRLSRRRRREVPVT
jgi:hypothetical protein